MNIKKENFLQNIIKYQMITHGKKVVIAFSGGPDSMALLHLLVSVKNALKIDLSAVYIDHGLRENSDDFKILDYVKKAYPDISVYIETINVKQFSKEHKLSIEEAARVLRYRVLEKKCEDLRFDYIATGHHQDDFAETVLMHLLEGAGFSGLSGIRLIHKNKIRPLLFFRKDEIIDFCQENKLPFSLDKTNDDIKFKRNKIRHQLLPFIENEFQQAIVNKLFQTGLIFQQEEKYLNELLSEIILSKNYNSIYIDIEKLSSLPPQGIKKVLEEKVLPEFAVKKTLNYNKFFEVYQAIMQKEHKKIKITNDIFMKIEQENIVFIKKTTWKSVSILQESHQYNIEEISLKFDVIVHSLENDVLRVKNEIEKLKKEKSDNINSIYLNYEKLEFPLSIRVVRKEDTFIPLGLEYSVKVKRYLKDKNVSEALITTFPVLVDKSKKILALPGFLPEKNCIVSEKTNKILEIKFFDFFNSL